VQALPGVEVNRDLLAVRLELLSGLGQDQRLGRLACHFQEVDLGLCAALSGASGNDVVAVSAGRPALDDQTARIAETMASEPKPSSAARYAQ
jgi:hypothetical protein